jgi:hypothetical protein
MTKYRRKGPVEVEAFRWHGRQIMFTVDEDCDPCAPAGSWWFRAGDSETAEWVLDLIDAGHLVPTGTGWLLAMTEAGMMPVSPGDWIVLDEGGELHAYSHDNFLKLFEPFEELAAEELMAHEAAKDA